MPTVLDAQAELTAPGQPFEMGEEVVGGAPVRVWRHAPATLRDILLGSRRFAGADFLVYAPPAGDTADRLTFEHHFAAAATLSHRLVEEFAVRPGDRVAIAMRNFPEWAIAFWAAAAAGAVVVPLNAWWTADELGYGLADAEATVLFCDDERAGRLHHRLAGLHLGDRTIVARPAGSVPSGTRRFDEVLGPVDAGAELPDVALGPDDDATIFYTSGTTGRPKGALGTHRNICTNVISLQYSAALAAVRRRQTGAPPPPKPATGQTAYLLSVPFFHVTGCHSTLVMNTFVGGKVVMMHKWDPERALELIEHERITSFGGVPSMVMQILDSPRFATTDTSSVVRIGYGGAPAPPELVRRLDALFPGRMPSNGYGMTETSSVAVMNAGVDYVRHPTSIGVPVPVCDARIVDGDGTDVPGGAIGELVLRGPNVVSGYWRNPDATSTTFAGGWLHTGDIARRDEEGFIYIVDRAKDMLIRGGENVYCVEVEAALFEHPAVADAAVIGVPHPVLGEEVGAVVQLRAGHDVDEAALRAFAAERLAGFKVPVRIWFTEALPRNPAGKVLKRELRDALLSSEARP